jgi:hypothetical protein
MNTPQQRETANQLMQRWKSLQMRRELWEVIWQDVTDLVLPRLSDWSQTDAAKPQKYGIKAFSGSAKSALRLASDGLQGYLVPRTAPWFRLQLRPTDMMDIPGARKWVEEVEEHMYSALNRSNFYDQIGEVFDTGLSIGTSTVFVRENIADETLHFQSRHPKEIYLSNDNLGNVDTWFRDYWVSGKVLLEEFPDVIEDDLQLMQMIKHDPYQMHRVLHAVFPRETRIWDKIDAGNKPYASIYMLHEKQLVLREGGFDRIPAITWRYRVAADEEYGTSPAIDALVDVIRENEVAKTNMDARQLAISPPIMYSPNLRGKINIRPRGMIERATPMDTIEPLNLLGQYPFGVEQEQMLKEAIRQHFNADFFLLLSQQQAQGRTATEVMEMAGERAAVMGATVGRVESELLDAVLGMVYQIEMDAGRLPIPPDELVEAGEIDFDYVGPLAQLQKKHYGQKTIIDNISQLIPLMQIDEGVKDIIDFDILARKMLDTTAFPADSIRSENEVEELRIQKAEIQAAMMQQEQQAQAAQNYKATNEPPMPGSPAEQLAARMPGA